MGRYIDKSDVEDRYGQDNVRRWSNLDNDSTLANTSRITSAISYAEDYIDDRLRHYSYTLPLSASEGTLRTIKEVASLLAGVWLYESRGADDTDEFGRPQNKLSAMRNRAERLLNQVVRGEITLGLGRISNDPTAPRVV